MDAKLVMFKPSGKRKDFPIAKEGTVLGRAVDCDLRIPLLSVSRQHCEVSILDDRVHVKDLGSSNGTYVNNTRIEETDLGPGDRLVVGPVVFAVQIDGEPSEIEPIASPTVLSGDRSGSDIEDALDLGADPFADSGEMDAQDTFAEDQSAGSAADVDPLAALEALTEEEEEEDPGKKGTQ